MIKNQNKTLKIAIILIAIIAISSIIAVFNPLEKLQLQASNFLYYTHPSKHPIIIVAIDEKSQIGQNGLGSFKDWNRAYHAQVIQNLEKYHPAAIGIDIQFKDRTNGIKQNNIDQIINSADPLSELQKYSSTKINPDDQILSTTLHKYNNIVLAFPLYTTAPSYQKMNSRNTVFISPYKLFADLAIGFNRIFEDADGIIHNYPLEITLNHQTYFSFAAQILQKILKYSSDIPQDHGQLKINFNQRPPLDLSHGLNQPNVKNISYIDVYNNQYPSGFNPNYFKGKIILIGAYYKTSGDNYLTAISSTNPMPGVMIHAQAIQTILDQNWLRNINIWEQMLTILILVLISALVCLTLKIRYSLATNILLILIYNLILAPLFFRNFGIILNLIYPNIAIIFSIIIIYAYRYFTEFRQKSSLKTNLGKFVEHSLIEQSLEDNANLTVKVEKKEITVMFTDIVNFTSISEKLQPISTVELLNEYIKVMTNIIIKNGGTIDKFEGDAIMAIFGAPNEQQDHAQRAAQTAIEMRTKLPELNQKWENDPPLSGGEKKPQIDFRVGLSSGEAVVGNIGSENRLSYTAIGDIVNLGSRLESVNKIYNSHIMISEKTYNLISQKYFCRFADYIRVKGKHQPVKIFELLKPINSATQEDREQINLYHHGLDLYFHRDFKKALDILQNQLLKKYPNDYLALIYAGRCQVLKSYPPKSDWDFVYDMKHK